MSSGWSERTSLCRAFSCARSLSTLQFTPVACGGGSFNTSDGGGNGSRVAALALTHVVGEDVGDGHEDGVLGGGGGQVQPELQVTDRVAAQVLQLRNTTHDNITNDLLLVF